MWLSLIFALLCNNSGVISLTQAGSTTQANEAAARERARKANQAEFKESFRSIQVVGKNLLKAHEEGTLVPDRLAKEVRSIQKSARSLRSLLALGPPSGRSRPKEPELRTADDFDKAIRDLSQMVFDFVRNPIHQNPKVFDTDKAGEAAADLVEIVELARLIERRARDYTRP